jgi:hypothetical protein
MDLASAQASHITRFFFVDLFFGFCFWGPSAVPILIAAKRLLDCRLLYYTIYNYFTLRESGCCESTRYSSSSVTVSTR